MNPAKEIQIRYFVIDPKDIVYLKAVLESYEGMVVVRTVEVGKPVIELLIAGDFAHYLVPVIEALRDEIDFYEIGSPEDYKNADPEHGTQDRGPLPPMNPKL